jgi:hypothetical protein
MTAKEKALELIDKFNEYTVKAMKYHANGKIDECKEDAKECALIAAREIVDTLYEYHYDSASGAYEFWTEVEAELELL